MRPETAQGIFLNFKTLYEFNQKRLPLIVAQIGKSFRNEISPKGGLLRQREFLMAEIEHFCDPILKYKPYQNFSKVSSIEISFLTSQSQEESKPATKIKLREAVDKVKY